MKITYGQIIMENLQVIPFIKWQIIMENLQVIVSDINIVLIGSKGKTFGI